MDRSSLYSLNGSRLELAPKPSMGQAERHKPPSSDDSLGFIIPLLLTLLELASLGVISWHHWQEAKKPPVEEAPEVVENTSLCRDGAASYEYRMVFRLGNPTATFNTARAFLDFELLGLDGERQGEVCRVDLSKLPNSVYGEVNCLIQRLNPLPPLLGLRAHHSDPSGTIFLYDYQLENGQTGATMEIRQFNVHLTNLPTVYKGKVLREEALEEGYYPEVPTPPWAPLEVALLAFFTVANTCLAVSCLEFFNHSYHPSVRSQIDHRQGNLVRSLHDIAIALPLMGTLMCGIILSFKYTLKK